jgi:hypothetical protein
LTYSRLIDSGGIMTHRIRAALGAVLVLVGFALLADQMGWLGDWQVPVWSLVFVGLGIVSLVIAVGRREDWWAVIPTCLFLALAAFLYVTEKELIPEDIATGGFLFLGIGLPFWLILLIRGRSAWWALIPGGVLTFVALSVALASLGEGWTGSLILWGVAVPFWLLYLFDRERWWALIPAGTMTTIGSLPLLAERWPGEWVGALTLAGLAATFLLVFLLGRPRQDFSWALWPGGVCLVLAVAILLLTERASLFLPALLIIGGVAALILGLRRR